MGEYYDKAMKPLIESEKLKFKTEKCCHICEKPFDNIPEKVMDHDNLKGQFRGAAHNSFNLNYQNPRFIPIFFHNLAGYDAHFFIKQFGEDNSDIKLIPNIDEKYISFSKIIKYDFNKHIKLRFIDSFKFLSSSLDKLSKNLEKDQFKELAKYFPKEQSKCSFRKYLANSIN